MSAEFLPDSNVLLYSLDLRVPAKRAVALTLLDRALVGRRGVISWQVVQEFLNVVLHKPAGLEPPEDLPEFLDRVLGPLCHVWPSVPLWRTTLGIQRESGYRLYDSLVVAGALEAGVDTLHSEDLQDGRRFGRLTIVNPFKDLPATSG